MSLTKKLKQVRIDTSIAPAKQNEDKDIICSQDFFCTPDFITPVECQFEIDFQGNKENVNVPTPTRTKRPRPEAACAGKSNNRFSTVIALRQRVISPPCVKNPFLPDQNVCDNLRSSRTHVNNCIVGGSSQSRYRDEFHEIEEIGRGSFSCVYKVMKRIDGCHYAVKRCHRQLTTDSERRKALTEVQALASIGSHDNILRYFSSWFENDHLYIQTELCDTTLRHYKAEGTPSLERSLLETMWQVVRGVEHLHSQGVVHLDLKPENIYVVKGVYKIGDFGRATRVDGSISIEEGDARYMPLELINDDYSELEKADMFALGATFYELARGSPLSNSGNQFQSLRHGKLSLLPGFSLNFQSMLKALLHPNPKLRPSATELLNTRNV